MLKGGNPRGSVGTTVEDVGMGMLNGEDVVDDDLTGDSVLL